MQLKQKSKKKTYIMSTMYYGLFTIAGLLMILKQPIADYYQPAMIYTLRTVFLSVGVASIYFIRRIGHMLFTSENDEWFFCVMIAFMPEFIQIYTYLNTTAITLLSISMILYSWVLLIQTNNDRKNLLLLSIGTILCTVADPQGYGYLITTIVLFSQLVQFKKNNWNRYIAVILLFMASVMWNALRFFVFGFSPSAYLPKWIGDLLKAEASFGVEKALSLRRLWMPYFIYFHACIFIGFILFFIYMTHERSVFNITIQAATKKRHLLETYFGLNVSIVLIYGIITAFHETIALMAPYLLPMIIPISYFISVGFGKFTIHMLRLKPKYRQMIGAIVPAATYVGMFLSICSLLLYLLIV